MVQIFYFEKFGFRDLVTMIFVPQQLKFQASYLLYLTKMEIIIYVTLTDKESDQLLSDKEFSQYVSWVS